MTNTNILKKLSDKNTKPTSMRVLVYDALANQNAAMSISDIEMYLGNVDRTTIYRTLKTFEAKGLVHHIQEDNLSSYLLCHDGCSEEAHKDWHLHFYCKICKKTVCREDVLLPEHFDTTLRIDEVQFFAKGICEDCLST